jgi:sulfatase modifying factor 1
MDISYAVDFGRDSRQTAKTRSRGPSYRRSSGGPARVSGMHCRRNKRWTWGSGRGARLMNLKAFASAVILALTAAMSGSIASGADITVKGIDFNLVGGNPAASPAGNGFGVVPEPFYAGVTEVTVAQYAAFLNATGGVNDTFKGGQPITFSGGSYTPNAGFANKPITNVNWFDAARYVNWLETGSTESGVYALNGSNTVVPRAPGALFFLPSADEWTKSAYYNPSGNSWNTYATQASTLPAATGPNGSNPNSANYANAVGGTTDVGAYSVAQSSYGLYDMLGNVAEILETSQGGQIIRTGGNWFGATAPTSSTALTYLDPAFTNGQIGFRVAANVAVPEPGTVALAVSGLVGLGGLGMMRRRRATAAVGLAG